MTVLDQGKKVTGKVERWEILAARFEWASWDFLLEPKMAQRKLAKGEGLK